MKFKMTYFVFCLFLGLAIFPETVCAQETPLTVVGNSQSVPSSMDMNQLRSVLKGERLRWDDGTKVVIALMKTNTPVGINTCERVYNMSGNELNKYFLALVFQGKVKAPIFFSSPNELESFVSQTPGAIGVLQNVTDNLLKVVLVDGAKQI